MASREPPFSANAEDKVAVLSHRFEIDSNLITALQNLENGNFSDLKHDLLAIQTNMRGLHDYLSTTIEPKYYGAQRLPNSTIATKVFAVPELLEAVVDELDIADIMSCYGVSRTFRDTIESSQKLQTRLFLRPDLPSDKKRIPFKDWTFNIMENQKLFELRVRASLGWKGRFPIIGTRWKAMFATQPPIDKMKYWIECDPPGPDICTIDPGNPVITFSFIEVEKGITIGDLYEKAKELFQLHRDCKDMSQEVYFQRTL